MAVEAQYLLMCMFMGKAKPCLPMGYVKIFPPAYTAIVCENDYESCGVMGYTPEGIPVLMLAKDIAYLFEPYGLMIWELKTEQMVQIWDKITNYNVQMEWVGGGAYPLESLREPSAKKRLSFKKARREWAAKMLAPFAKNPEALLRLPPKEAPVHYKSKAAAKG